MGHLRHLFTLLLLAGCSADSGTVGSGGSPTPRATSEVAPPAAPVPAAAGPISGKVVDLQAAPLAEARVSAYPVTPDSLDTAWREAHTESTYTAADGTFTLNGLPAGRCFVTASAPGHCGTDESRQQCETGDQLLTLQLAPCAGVSGQVFDAGGYPLPGVTITLGQIDPPPNTPITRGGHDTQTTTNSRGRYTFESLPTGKIQLTATHPRAGQTSITLTLTTGEHPRGVDLVLN